MRALDSLRWRLVAAMLLVFGFGLGGAILARPFEGRGGLLSRFDVDFIREPYQDILVLVLFTAIATALTVVVSAWSLRHLREASREAAGVGPRNPDARITTGRLPQEIRPMVAAMNAALDRMADAFAAERRFVADAAHELRTPLTVLSLRLQEARLSQAPDWSRIDHDVAQMGRVVSQLLELARHDVASGADARRMEPTDLGRAAREAAALILPLADAAGRSVVLDLPEKLPVRGRQGALRDAFRNLLENALIHGKGTIRVTGMLIDDAGKASQACVTVSDEGEALAETERERMFERFRKASPNAPGSGLGLSIVREILRAHGGVASFAPGVQTSVRICLPALPGWQRPARHAGTAGSRAGE